MPLSLPAVHFCLVFFHGFFRIKALLHPRGQLFHLKIRQFRQCVAEILQGFLPVLLHIRSSSVGIDIRVIVGHPVGISPQKLQIIVIRRVVRRKIQRVNIALREQSAGTRRVKPPAGIAGRGSRQQHAALLRLDLKFLSSRIDRHMQLAAACRAEIPHEVKIIPDPALSPLAHRDVRPGELRLSAFPDDLVPESALVRFLILRLCLLLFLRRLDNILIGDPHSAPVETQIGRRVLRFDLHLLHNVRKQRI